MKLLIGIPAYNEAHMIGKVLEMLPKRLSGLQNIDVLVVDDGSSDETAKIAYKSGVIVLSHLINRGLGAALRTIFAYALNQKYDILVTFDADGQHNPKDILHLIDPILGNKKDVVIGTRWKQTAEVPFSRYIINKIANFITFLLFGIYTSDSQSGLRAFNQKALKMISTTTDGMEVSSEFFKEIQRNKLRFGEVPIQAVYTQYSIVKGQRMDNAPELLLRLIIRFLR